MGVSRRLRDFSVLQVGLIKFAILFACVMSAPAWAESKIDISDFNLNIGRTVSAPAWSPDNKFLAVEVGGKIKILDVATKQLLEFEGLKEVKTGGSTALSWSPDGKYLAISNLGRLLLFETRTWRQIASKYIIKKDADVKCRYTSASGSLMFQEDSTRLWVHCHKNFHFKPSFVAAERLTIPYLKHDTFLEISGSAETEISASGHGIAGGAQFYRDMGAITYATSVQLKTQNGTIKRGVLYAQLTPEKKRFKTRIQTLDDSFYGTDGRRRGVSYVIPFSNIQRAVLVGHLYKRSEDRRTYLIYEVHSLDLSEHHSSPILIAQQEGRDKENQVHITAAKKLNEELVLTGLNGGMIGLVRKTLDTFDVLSLKRSSSFCKVPVLFMDTSLDGRHAAIAGLSNIAVCRLYE